MAEIVFSITVPTDKKEGIVDDFCAYHGYQETVTDPENPEATIANPETKAEFARKKVLEFIKNSVVSYKAQKSAEEARLASIQEVENISFS